MFNEGLLDYLKTQNLHPNFPNNRSHHAIILASNTNNTDYW